MAISKINEQILLDLCDEYKTKYNPNKGFFLNLYDIMEVSSPSTFTYRGRITKSKIKEFYKSRSDNFRIKLKFLKGYLIGVLQEKDKKTKDNSSKKDVITLNNIPFKIGKKEIKIYKKPKLLLNHLKNIFPRRVYERDKLIENKKGKEFVNSLFKIESDIDGLYIKGINTHGLNVGKNTWISISSDDKESVISKIKNIRYNTEFIFGKKLEKINISNIKQINFLKNKKEARLIINQTGIKQFRISWKHGGNVKLKEEIANYLGITEDGSSLILDYKDDEEMIYDFFKENKIDYFKRFIIYKELLTKYSSFIEVTNKEKPRLKIERIYSELNRILKKEKYELQKIYLRTIDNIYFPRRKSKKMINEGLKPSNCFFRIVDKDKKIVQHLFLDHEFFDTKDIKEFLEKYFIFHPFVALDYRNENLEKFAIDTGTFLKKLKEGKKDLLKLILKDKDIISNEEKEIYFKNSVEHLKRLNQINKKLSNQQKGAYFESICFGMLSQIFLTKKVGNSLNPDGKFILDDEKILYDAKNLRDSTSENPLLKSVTKRNGHIKDIDYIKKGRVKEYVFIIRDSSKDNFLEVKNKIEQKIKCNVSAIKVSALKELVEIYLKDPRKISLSKIKNIIFSGNFIEKINEKEVISRRLI